MTVIMSTLRRRNCLLTLLFIFVPFFIILLLSAQDLTSEQEALMQRIAELQMKLNYLDSMYKLRQEDALSLDLQFNSLLSNCSNQNVIPQSIASLYKAIQIGPQYQMSATNTQSNIETLLKTMNLTGSRLASGLDVNMMLKLPSPYQFLPHLLDDAQSLKPAFYLSHGRTSVSIVLGIPTVKREKQSYLIPTLHNLTSGMSKEEMDDSLIIVFIAETDLEYVLQVAKQIEDRFSNHIESGLIEILSPRASYYPDMNKLQLTFGDSLERVKWRTKQNLDFAYLMSYARTKGMFYVQLEDDIVAKRNYVSLMKTKALEKTSKKEPWFVLDFCQLGFIGKMFKSYELPWLIQFFQMFHNDKPVDWLLDDLTHTKICNVEKDTKTCKKEQALLWIHYKPSLFQHIGTHSSLKGKLQKLKDKQFGKLTLFYPHINPEAEVRTKISPYKHYTLQRAYLGQSFFWGLLPQSGDHLVFKFQNPIYIKHYLLRSGNDEHPSDRFYNTSVEVLPEDPTFVNGYEKSLNVTNDGFVIVGGFNNLGIAEGSVDESLGPIKTLRLTVHSDSENWVILSEIYIQDRLR